MISIKLGTDLTQVLANNPDWFQEFISICRVRIAYRKAPWIDELSVFDIQFTVRDIYWSAPNLARLSTKMIKNQYQIEINDFSIIIMNWFVFILFGSDNCQPEYIKVIDWIPIFGFMFFFFWFWS